MASTPKGPAGLKQSMFCPSSGGGSLQAEAQETALIRSAAPIELQRKNRGQGWTTKLVLSTAMASASKTLAFPKLRRLTVCVSPGGFARLGLPFLRYRQRRPANVPWQVHENSSITGAWPSAYW